MSLQPTEDDIERFVELQMDRLDKHYMNDILTTEQYDQRIQEINDWAEDMYSLILKRSM